MRSVIRELIETALLALVIFLGLQFTIQNFRVEGSSMQPTLEENQYLLANKLIYLRITPQAIIDLLPFKDTEREGPFFAFHPPRRGEVIIFRFPKDESRDFVKRVIGISGDTVEIRLGKVFVNGAQLDEPYVTHQDRRTMASVKVGPDSYFVMGDNRRASHDSRAWGTVPLRLVIGKAWMSYWPLDRINLIKSSDPD
jgi:signal peptidase I